MYENISTMDDFEFENKWVLLRIDINSTVIDGKIEDDERIKRHLGTIKELMEHDARVAILAHQGRPGEDDFTTLEPHAEIMSEELDNFEYVPDVFGPTAKKKIRSLEPGEVILLENVRFYSEERINRDPEWHARRHLVRNLAPLFDIFVNDAFAAAHRSNASLVGFTRRLPSCVGRVMEREIEVLETMVRDEMEDGVFVIGGSKIEDAIKVIRRAIEMDNVRRVLLGGLVGNLFLWASGVDLGKPSRKFLDMKGYTGYLDEARELLEEGDDVILVPEDVALNRGGEREEVDVDELPADAPVFDIGTGTIERYRKEVESAGMVVANGPMGVYEEPGFEKGTYEVLNAIADSEAFSVIGGGHIIAAAKACGAYDSIDHVSTGGGAMLRMLAGERLPAIDAILTCPFSGC
ncbi:phosphoglycerate kinase [Methanopyrus kandleri]|uniref:Phosphoglycerate kinase n=2 Tax=Methanopyrus kandleri TaxID=2320 RepID=PGK_METKA|nr:phosphoglycerate kinase [Methanopyrus kandleri]Q8TUU1.1 RecName: Full=Phosphoglycerate kinase [Methanopyrus kandleri AV19]AAM02875.1 3-phosphoglycerate kinase [Methanopyrus kandleri AV19]HII70894.1 phosphoglycerate kinase [Methanopyrus kandleri]